MEEGKDIPDSLSQQRWTEANDILGEMVGFVRWEYPLFFLWTLDL